MATYLITGAARGLGLELTRQLLELPEAQVSMVFTITRSEPQAGLYDLIRNSHGRVKNILATVNDTESIEEAARQVRGHLGSRRGLDVLVNNAGILGENHPDGRIENCSPDELALVLDTNLIGPHRVTRAFLPLLREGQQKKVINISSTMGAFSWAERLHANPAHAYKISKTALNMLHKIMSLDLADEGFIFLSISPGYLKTDMSPDADTPVSVGASEVRRMILEATPAWNGKFLNIHVPGQEESFAKYDGKEIPW